MVEGFNGCCDYFSSNLQAYRILYIERVKASVFVVGFPEPYTSFINLIIIGRNAALDFKDRR